MSRSRLTVAALLACSLAACSAPTPQGESARSQDMIEDSSPATPPTMPTPDPATPTPRQPVSAPAPPMIEDPAPTPDPVASTSPAAEGSDAARDCDAGKARSFVGRVASSAVVQQVVDASGARSARVIKPGMAVTMDFRGDRINVDVDAGNVITELRCG